MSSFHGKRCLLRILSQQHMDLDLGGMYATAQAPEDVVRVAPQTPPFVERQVWIIESAPDKGKNVVTIQADGMNAGGMTFWHNQEGYGDGPVILQEEKYFRLQLVQNVKGIPIYSISPLDAPERIGATLFVGSGPDNAVITKWYPVVRGMDNPVWAFYPA